MTAKEKTLRQEIEWAVADWSRHGLYPPPYALPPNLELASRALAELDAQTRTVGDLAMKLIQASEIIYGLTDPDPCEYDHNHSCQAHGDFYIPAGEKCITQRAKDYLL